MSRPVRASMLLVMLLLGVVPMAVAREDPFAGTWVSRGSRSGQQAAGGMTIIIEVIDNGLHYRSRSVRADGRVAVAEYTGSFDGTAVTVTGSSGLLAPVSLKRLDSHAITAAYLRGLQVIATSRWAVTRDGRRMTILTQSPDANGVQRHTVLRLVRAPDRNPAE